MEVPMPDEKIDQKRPVDAENESKPIQQRHVDDAVDDSFPASDPPAWTTSASKSVAAECEPDDLNEAPIPPGQGLEGQSGSTARSGDDRSSGLAHDLYQRGQGYLEQGRRYMPEAERYYRQGTETMSRSVQEHPLAAVLAVGALGCALGWMLGRRTTDPGRTRQWQPGSNQRLRETQNWRPTPPASRRAGPMSAHDDVEVASHTNDSF
jgi:ElaB/YqjD/DUF883 family membrane-anchored ribosome-binding protein